jgi:ATP-binding cassette subfamily B protein
MKQPTNPTAAKLAIRNYMAQIRQNWHVAVPGLLLPGVGTILGGFVPPLVLAAMIERFAETPLSLHQSLPYLFAFGGVWLLGEMLWRIAFLCLNRADSRGMQNLYIDGMEQLAKKDIGFFHDNFGGALTKKALGYGKSFESFMDTLAFNVFTGLIPILFATVVLWRYSPWLVAILYVLIAIVVSIVIPLIRRRAKLTKAREEAANVMAGHVADTIGNMDAVQSFAHEEHELKRHRVNVSDYMTKARRSWDYHTTRIDMAISPFYVFINVAGLAAAIHFGKDGATIAAIFVTFTYYARITEVMWEFNRIYRNLENAVTEAAQFTELLMKPSALQEAKNPIKLNITRGDVHFKDVTFTYHGDNQDPLFDNLNLHIKAGEKLALVGHSGGGKTTVTKLLLRFADIDGGELLIDGQNIAKGRLRDLRGSIAYVPQEPIMFHRSIRENIRYGRLDANDETVIDAAKKAHAHEFIESLPQGYDTLVGERGVKLSGGQRQRIAIARAIIKDAPILVLDEATSALDSESEKLIQSALWKLMQGRTTIVIAHRLSTIQKMDRIVVLDKGTIIEQGAHAELLKQKGVYATLWAHQSGGFIEE